MLCTISRNYLFMVLVLVYVSWYQEISCSLVHVIYHIQYLICSMFTCSWYWYYQYSIVAEQFKIVLPQKVCSPCAIHSVLRHIWGLEVFSISSPLNQHDLNPFPSTRAWIPAARSKNIWREVATIVTRNSLFLGMLQIFANTLGNTYINF